MASGTAWRRGLSDLPWASPDSRPNILLPPLPLTDFQHTLEDPTLKPGLGPTLVLAKANTQVTVTVLTLAVCSVHATYLSSEHVSCFYLV